MSKEKPWTILSDLLIQCHNAMICCKLSVPNNTKSAKICEMIYFTIKHCFSVAHGYFYTSPSLGCIRFAFFNGKKGLMLQVLPWSIALNPSLQIHQSDIFYVMMESSLKTSEL